MPIGFKPSNKDPCLRAETVQIDIVCNSSCRVQGCQKGSLVCSGTTIRNPCIRLETVQIDPISTTYVMFRPSNKDPCLRTETRQIDPICNTSLQGAVWMPNYIVRNVWRTHGYETTLHVTSGGCARMLKQGKSIWALYSNV